MPFRLDNKYLFCYYSDILIFAFDVQTSSFISGN